MIRRSILFLVAIVFIVSSIMLLCDYTPLILLLDLMLSPIWIKKVVGFVWLIIGMGISYFVVEDK